jgi:hypothetical protein
VQCVVVQANVTHEFISGGSSVRAELSPNVQQCYPYGIHVTNDNYANFDRVTFFEAFAMESKVIQYLANEGL